uniref:BZIP domain-containing protein n=1 Tax=Ascaris lumbricoides TaxID=6252 RepID=A0A0M3I1H2_ASCLU
MEAPTKDVREEAEEIVILNMQRRYRIKLLAEREAELLKKKVEVEAELRLSECQVTAKEEQLESVKSVTNFQKAILNRAGWGQSRARRPRAFSTSENKHPLIFRVRVEMFVEQEKRANLDKELRAAEDSLNRLRVSEQHKREQRERRVCEITARLKNTPWAVKRQEVLCTVNTLKKELEESSQKKNTLVKELEEKKAQVASCKALPFKKFCIVAALMCLRMRNVRHIIAKELVKIAKIKIQVDETEVTPDITQDSSQEPSTQSQSFAPFAVGVFLLFVSTPILDDNLPPFQQTEEVVLNEAPKDVSEASGKAKCGVKGPEQNSGQTVAPLFVDKEADLDQNTHEEHAVNNDMNKSGTNSSGSGEESSSLRRVIIDEDEQRESSELSPRENEDESMGGIENVSQANHFFKSTDDGVEHPHEWNESGKGQTPSLEGSLDGDDASVSNDAPFEEGMLSGGSSEQMLFMAGSGNSGGVENDVCPKNFFGSMDDNMGALFDLSGANENASTEELDPATLLNLSTAVQVTRFLEQTSLRLASSLFYNPAAVQQAAIGFRATRIDSNGRKSRVDSSGRHRIGSSHARSPGGTTAADARSRPGVGGADADRYQTCSFCIDCRVYHKLAIDRTA